MTKHKLQKILEKAGIQTNTMELRVFVPTENAVIYMQVGDGSQLDRDEDESGTPYDGYIDYKTSEWDYDENWLRGRRRRYFRVCCKCGRCYFG